MVNFGKDCKVDYCNEKLSREEKETVIQWSYDDKDIKIDTTDVRVMTKLKNRNWKITSVTVLKDDPDTVIGMSFSAPKNALTFKDITKLGSRSGTVPGFLKNKNRNDEDDDGEEDGE